MAAACALVAASATTNVGPISTSSFTPTAGAVLVCFGAGTGTNAVDFTCTSTGNTATWDNIDFGVLQTANNGGMASVWVMQGTASAVGTVVTLTYTSDNTTGNHIYIYEITGMTNTGSAAVRQFAIDENVAAGTPQAAALALAAKTYDPTIVFVHDEATAAGWTAPSGWTEATSPAGENAFSTPSSRTAIAHRDSGFTGTTVTWQTASTGEYTSYLVEFAAPAPASGFVSVTVT